MSVLSCSSSTFTTTHYSRATSTHKISQIWNSRVRSNAHGFCLISCQIFTSDFAIMCSINPDKTTPKSIPTHDWGLCLSIFPFGREEEEGCPTMPPPSPSHLHHICPLCVWQQKQKLRSRTSSDSLSSAHHVLSFASTHHSHLPPLHAWDFES